MDSSAEVPLQPSVEETIKKICFEKCIQPPDASARRLLLTISEASAIEILNKISGSRSIRTFSGFIAHMVKNSVSVSSPNDVSLTPRKRSPPPSSAARSPLKYSCCISPNPDHGQFVRSPVSTSKTRTIPYYFHKSPNDGDGSSVLKQITAISCLGGLTDENSNTATWHLAESSKAAPRVQKQLIFPPDRSLDNGNHCKLSQHLFDSSNVSHPFSVVEKQRTLSPCSTSKGTSLRRFSDFSSATHNSSLIPEPHSLPPCESFRGATHSTIEPGFGSMTRDCSDRRVSHAISQQSLLLAELEFRKLFIVYSYVGRKELEEVVSVTDAIEISGMKNMTMYDFESKIWAKLLENAH